MSELHHELRHALGQTSGSDATPTMESPSSRIHRWIGGQDHPVSNAMSSKSPNSEEVDTRRQLGLSTQLDWELEEFEREMALRFVMRDLQLGLEELRGRNRTASRPRVETQRETPARQADADAEAQSSDSSSSWLRTKSSAATLQPFTPTARCPPPAELDTPHSQSSTSSSHPGTPRTPAFCMAGSTPADVARPISLVGSQSTRSRHRPSSSVLSLSSHFSSCTSASPDDDTSAWADTDAEGEADTGRAPSVRSVVSHLGHRIRQSLRSPPGPPSSFRLRTGVAPPVIELPPSDSMRKRRRVSVTSSIAPKKKRLLVRGIRPDDDYAVEGIKRWACGLGEVSRICRAQDGTLWIEFRDRRVANDVCCLHAQVQIPHVGRVVLDWAEGRQPG